MIAARSKCSSKGWRSIRRTWNCTAAFIQEQAILRRPPQERVAALLRYPDQKALPTPLLYDLALSLAETGEFSKARALFRNRVFEREEGGVNVREVYLEVQMLAAAALAKQGHAQAARGILQSLARPVEGLEFTRDGLEAILAEARMEFELGRIEALLGSPEAAREHWRRAAKGRDVFAVLAERSRGNPPGAPKPKRGSPRMGGQAIRKACTVTGCCCGS